MAFKDSVKIDKAFKNLLGYAYSEEEKYYWEEGIFWALSVASEDIWAESSKITYNDPNSAVANGVAQKLDHYVMTPNSSAFYNGKDRAWTIRETPGDENSALLTGFIPHVRYGDNYRFQLYDYNDNLITVPQMIEHGIIFDYSNGVVVLNNDSNYTFQTPFKITVWRYVGQTGGGTTVSGTGCTPDTIVVADIDWIEVTSDAPQDFVTLCVVDNDGNIVYEDCVGGSGGGGSSTFIGLTDTENSYASHSNEYVKVKSDETGLEFGVPTFLQLTDTPSNYNTFGGKLVGVKADESGLEFVSPSIGLCDVIVDNPADLQSAINSMAGVGGTIGIKRDVYTPSSAIILPQTDKRISLIGEYPTFIRPDNDSVFKLDNVNGVPYIYSLKFLVMDGSGKSGNYGLVTSNLGASTQNFDKLQMFGCVFQNNSYHAFYGRISQGMVVNNSFYQIDGYAFYGGLLGLGTVYDSNIYYNNNSVPINNEHGFLWSNDGNGIYFQNNSFTDSNHSSTFNHLVYAIYSGSMFYARVSNNTFKLFGTTLPAGVYMVYLNASAGKNYLLVSNNFGIECGVGHECNLTTDTTSPNYIIVENNYCTPN